MALSTPLTTLFGIEHPILLAPMDLVSDGRLVEAVSRGGGLGLLGGGYGDAAWLTRELGVASGAGVPFGVGFITWSLAKQPHLLELALEHRPAAVMLSFGDPAPFVPAIRKAGARVICQVQSLALARAAEQAGADVLVAHGTEGGGHGSTRGLFTLLPEIVDAVGGRLPVVAAGGVADGRGLAAALMLGAAGVLIGTRFYATQESAAAAAAKQRICAAGGDDTVRSVVFDISRRNVWPAPFTGRCLRNAHVDRWLGREVELLRNLHEEAPRYVEAREQGDFDIAAVIAGEAVGLIRDVPSARALVGEIARTASALIDGRGAAHVAAAPRVAA
jgi:nitronate monooxygenase